MRHLWIVVIIVLMWPLTALAETPSFKINKQNCAVEKEMADHARSRLDNDIQKDFHDILMVNELAGGCGSLQFTDANMASNTNGFSFGLSQFDLATKPKVSLQTLNNILACARKEDASVALSDDDNAFLQKNAGRSTFALKQDRSAWERFYKMRPTLEAALRSKCGREYIEDSYISEIRNLDASTVTWWNDIVRQNPAMAPAERFFRLYELDLLNVFGGTEGFREVVAHERKDVCGRLCKAKVVPGFDLDGPVSVSDLIRYVLTTNCYGYIPQQTRQQDALRRLNTVLGKVDLVALPLDTSDRRYLATKFADTLARNKARFPESSDRKLHELVKNANGGVSVTGDRTPLDKRHVQVAIGVCAQ